MSTVSSVADSETRGADPAGQRRGRRAIWLICSGHFLAHYWVLLLPPVFPLLKAEFGVGYIELGALMTAFALASAVAHMPVGFLVDRVGALKVLLLGLSIEAVATAALGWAPSYGALMVLMIVGGAANSVFHPADYAILNASVPAERIGRAFSVHTFSGFLGWVVAPGAMVAFAAYGSWRLGLVVAGLAGLVVVAAMLLMRDSLRENGDGSPRPAPAPGAVKGAGLALLGSWPIVMCFLFFALIAMSQTGLQNFTVVALIQLYDATEATANIILTAFLAGSAAGILIGGYIADRTTAHARVAAFSYAAAAALLVLLGFTPPIWVVALVMTLAGILSGMVMPSRDMIVRALTPPEHMGKVFAFVSVGLNVGSILAPLLIGWVMDHGDPRWLFWIVAACILGGIVAVLDPRRRRTG